MEMKKYCPKCGQERIECGNIDAIRCNQCGIYFEKYEKMLRREERRAEYRAKAAAEAAIASNNRRISALSAVRLVVNVIGYFIFWSIMTVVILVFLGWPGVLGGCAAALYLYHRKKHGPNGQS